MRWVRGSRYALGAALRPGREGQMIDSREYVLMPSPEADEMLRLITELSNRISCKCDPLTKRKCLKCQARAFLATHAEANRGEGETCGATFLENYTCEREAGHAGGHMSWTQGIENRPTKPPSGGGET